MTMALKSRILVFLEMIDDFHIFLELKIVKSVVFYNLTFLFCKKRNQGFSNVLCRLNIFSNKGVSEKGGSLDKKGLLGGGRWVTLLIPKDIS